MDAHNKHRKQQKQSWVCQHGETTATFKRIGVAVGNESDERINAKNEVRVHAGTLGPEILDEQCNGKPKQHTDVRPRPPAPAK